MFRENVFRRPKENTISNDIRLTSNMRSSLCDLFLDIRYASSLLNECESSQRPKLSSFEFHDTLIKFGYQLLAVNSLRGSEPLSPLENLIHLGLAAFMMTLLRGLDRLIPENPLLLDLARLAGQSFHGTSSESQETFLWFLLIGKSSIFGHWDDEWLLMKMKHVVPTLGLQTWEEMRKIVSVFPWVNSLHNETGEEVWRRYQE